MDDPHGLTIAMGMFEDRVKYLGERVQDQQKGKAQERAREKARQDVDKEASKFPERQQQDFWCRQCTKDYIALGLKAKAGDYWEYRSHCPEGHMNVRYITSPLNDPYFQLSLKVKRDRIKYADAMLTPDDPRFKVVYPQQWKALQKMKEEHAQQTNQTEG